MRFITKKDIILAPRKKDSHKGDNGRILVIGGSDDYTGAVVLCGLAALRSGADWVTVAVPEKVGWAISSLTPDLVVKKIRGVYFSESNLKEILELENKFDTVLIGNGIGLQAKTFVKKYVAKTKKQMVIDADAIKAIGLQDIDNAIVTPHNKELDILLINSKIDKVKIKNIINEKNISKKADAIKKILNSTQFIQKKIVLLIKGRTDAIVSKDKIMFNKTGNPGMTKSGTGDVLSGLCAGYLSQSKNLYQSAINAAYINGAIGDILLKKKKGYHYLASDMVEEIKKIDRLIHK